MMFEVLCRQLLFQLILTVGVSQFVCTVGPLLTSLRVQWARC